MLRVLWVSHSGNVSGAEMGMIESVRGLVGLGHEVHVVLPWSAELAIRLKDLATSISYINCPWWIKETAWGKLSRARAAAHHLRAVGALWRVIKSVRPDVVVTNTLTIPAGAIAARVARVPHVWYVHELGARDQGLHFHFGNWGSLALMKHLSRRVLVNSRTTWEHFAPSISPARLCLVPYAVASATLTRRGEQAFSPGPVPTLILCGRKEPEKGHEQAIRALGLLAARGLRPRLVLLGTDRANYWQSLAALADELGVAGQVENLPFAEDPFALVAQADISLVCSQFEAFGRVTVEAMKLGKPVVGAASGGTAELIENGRTGLLYPPGRFDLLADQIEVLLRTPPLRGELGKAGRAFADREFSMEKHTTILVQALREAIDGPRGSRAGPVVPRC